MKKLDKNEIERQLKSQIKYAEYEMESSTSTVDDFLTLLWHNMEELPWLDRISLQNKSGDLYLCVDKDFTFKFFHANKLSDEFQGMIL